LLSSQVGREDGRDQEEEAEQGGSFTSHGAGIRERGEGQMRGEKERRFDELRGSV
jgi:hypothetical protein